MNQLRLFAEDRLGRGGWQRVCEAASVSSERCNLTRNYPDEETLAAIDVLCEARGVPRPVLMEDFGQFIVPALLRVYGSLVQPEWRTLDVLEHTEAVIHCVVRARHSGARPPALAVQRISATEARIVYTSPRRLCGLARGITRGVASHFGEAVELWDLECMHRDDPRCLISVTCSPAEDPL